MTCFGVAVKKHSIAHTDCSRRSCRGSYNHHGLTVVAAAVITVSDI